MLTVNYVEDKDYTFHLKILEEAGLICMEERP